MRDAPLLRLVAAIFALIALKSSAENALSTHANSRSPHYDPRSTIWSEIYPGELPPRRRSSLHANFMASLMLRLDTNRDLAVQRGELLDFLLNAAADIVDAGAGAVADAVAGAGADADRDAGAGASADAYTGATGQIGNDSVAGTATVGIGSDRNSVFHLCKNDFVDVDSDGNDRVSLEELGASELSVRGTELSATAWDRQVELLSTAFAAADSDADGALTRVEYGTIQQHALLIHLEREVNFVFEYADGISSGMAVGGSDGELSVDELAAIPRHAVHSDVQRLLGHPEL